MNVVIILPTYNEKENIEKLVPYLEEEIFPHIHHHKMFILIADDNSPDGTAEAAKEMMKKWENIHISSGEKHGLGAAYIRAMNYAIEKMDADALFEMDADGQHDPKKIPVFLEKIDKGYDMVIGNRYSDGGSIPPNWPIQRKAFSITANIFVRVVFTVFSIHDWTGGYRALRKEVFLKEKDKLTNYTGYIFQISFLHKALRDGFKIAEVPFHFSDRTLGNSKIAPLGYIISVVKYVITARIIELRRVIKFLFVGGTGFIVQVIAQELSVFLGVPDAFAAGIGAECAILSNFFWNHIWTFNDTRGIKESSNTFVKLVKFNVASLASIFIQSAAVFLAETLFGRRVFLLSHPVPTRILILFPTIIFIVIPLNYLIYNKIIWKTQYLKHEKPSQA